MQRVHADRSYKTMLGTAFYDRTAELGGLERLLATRRVTIIYGPRNVGKSELARYYLHICRSRERPGPAVVIDARRLRAAGLAEKPHMIDFLGVPRKEIIINIIKKIADLQRPGLADLALKILLALKEALSSSPSVLLFDEFHELPGYSLARPWEPSKTLGASRPCSRRAAVKRAWS